jgi:putative exporter of polyketide antibiotics
MFPANSSLTQHRRLPSLLCIDHTLLLHAIGYILDLRRPTGTDVVRLSPSYANVTPGLR